MFLSSTLIQLQPELNTLSLGGSRLLWNSKESQSCWRRSLSFFNSCEYVSVQLNRHSYFLVPFCSVVHCGIFLLSCICCGCGPGPRPPGHFLSVFFLQFTWSSLTISGNWPPRLSGCKDSTPNWTPPPPRPLCWVSEEVLLPQCLWAWRWRQKKLRLCCRHLAPPPSWPPQDWVCSAWWPTTFSKRQSSRTTCGCVRCWTTPPTDWWVCGRGRLLLDWGKRATCMKFFWPVSWPPS